MISKRYESTDIDCITWLLFRVYDNRDDFGFHIVNFPWLSGDHPRFPSFDVYIS